MAVPVAVSILVALPADGAGISGWVSGPREDATMEVGQRFDCTDVRCADAVACLYAAAPARPPGSRWLKAADVTDEDVWPWRAVEAWLATKVNAVIGNSLLDPSRPAAEWAVRDDPVVFEIEGETFARRLYRPLVADDDLEVPIWFWTSEGRLFTLFCTIREADLSAVRAPIHDLLNALHPGEPVRDDIPTRF